MKKFGHTKIRNILKNWKEIANHKEWMNEWINNEFYNNYLKVTKKWPKHHIVQFLTSIQTPHLIEEQSAKCEFSISEDDLICALKNMPKNKSSDNDGLIKKKLWEKEFWDELKILFIASLRKLFLREELSNSQEQVVTSLIEKKDKAKSFIQNWRPFSFLNTDMKILSIVTAQRLKKTILF